MRLLLALYACLASGSPIPQPEIQTWSEAARHEDLLRSDPKNDRVRSLLLGWYTRNYQDRRAQEPRLRHILYAIDHSPAMALVDSRSLRIDERDSTFPRVRAAWLRAVNWSANDPIVKIRAAQCLMRSDRGLAADWLRAVGKEAKRHNPLDDPPPFGQPSRWWNWGQVSGESTRYLAQLLTDAIAGITARTPWEGTGPMDPALRLSRFAADAVHEIERTTDAMLLAESAWWLHLTSESFERDGRPDRKFVPMAWRWLQRLEKIQDEPFSRNSYIDSFQRYWSRLLPEVVAAPLPRVRRNVQPLNASEPSCPGGPLVNIEVIVSPDGRPRFVNYTGGPPGTERDAVRLARKWLFPPGLDGTRPVEVQTMFQIRVCPLDTGR
jgi:hypothetical protein